MKLIFGIILLFLSVVGVMASLDSGFDLNDIILTLFFFVSGILLIKSHQKTKTNPADTTTKQPEQPTQPRFTNT